MGVGHVALALGASKAAPRVNVGWLVFAAILSDFLLGIFAALGLEHSTPPPDYADRHYLLFTFPYSHGLTAMLLWAAILAFLVARVYRSDTKRIFIVVGLVVLSHFLLDGLVHVAGLPLIGQDSPKLGLGLWKYLPLELSIETLMSVVGFIVYWRLPSSSKSAFGRYGMAIFLVLVTVMTWSQLLATVPPSPQQLTVSWIVVPPIFGAIAYVLDRKRAREVAATKQMVPKP